MVRKNINLKLFEVPRVSDGGKAWGAELACAVSALAPSS